MTNRDRGALHGIVVALLFFATAGVTSGPIGQALQSTLSALRTPPSAPITAAAVEEQSVGGPSVGGQSNGGYGRDDPRLTTLAMLGLPAVVVPAPPDQARPTVTHWLRNTADTTLWSGANSLAAAFTDLPAASYLRVTGPQDSGRWPVYYAGDGLLRRAGNGWVESTAVENVDAPAPGQVPSVDADASQPLPVWVQAFKSTTLWSGPDDKAVMLTDLPQWTFLKVGGLERGGRLLVNYAGDFSSRQAGIGWVDQSAVGPAGDPGVWVTNHRATTLWSGVDEQAVRFTDLPQWSKLRIVPGSTGRCRSDAD